MYYCPDCGNNFEKPKRIYETHGLSTPPFEELLVCPDCYSTQFYEKTSTHCRCCGARLPEKAEEYCSKECRKKGEKLWEKQQLKRKKELESPIGSIVKKTENYNKRYGTNYSYGQYVAFVESKKRRAKKCGKKKRNI